MIDYKNLRDKLENIFNEPVTAKTINTLDKLIKYKTNGYVKLFMVIGNDKSTIAQECLFKLQGIKSVLDGYALTNLLPTGRNLKVSDLVKFFNTYRVDTARLVQCNEVPVDRPITIGNQSFSEMIEVNHATHQFNKYVYRRD